MCVVVNLRRCVCGGKAAIEPEYYERVDENGNIYEHESWYCHCVKCEVSTGLCSCEESAADAWNEGDVCDRRRGRKKEAKRSGRRRRVAVNPISRYDAVTATGDVCDRRRGRKKEAKKEWQPSQSGSEPDKPLRCGNGNRKGKRQLNERCY